MIGSLTHWYQDPSLFSWRMVPGYLGAILIVASFLVRTMIPLRALSALSNLCIVIYACLDGQFMTFIVNAALLPLNLLRLAQMVKLVSRVRSAAHGSRAMEWLKPYMTRRRFRDGQMIFHKGDVADTMYYVVSGSFRLPELDKYPQPGEFVGELALLAPDGLRTQSLECVTKGELLAIRYDQVHELFFQNPDFGFYFMQLASARLFNLVSILQQELETYKAKD